VVVVLLLRGLCCAGVEQEPVPTGVEHLHDPRRPLHAVDAESAVGDTHPSLHRHDVTMV